MSQIIELPDPLFAEIKGYANRVAGSPVGIIKQAWDEFLHRHPAETVAALEAKPDTEELLKMVNRMAGSLSLPPEANYEELILEARMEKYGPL